MSGVNLEVEKKEQRVKYTWLDEDYNESNLIDYVSEATQRSKEDGNLLREDKVTDYFIQGNNGRGYRLSMGFLKLSGNYAGRVTSRFNKEDFNQSDSSRFRLVFTGSPNNINVNENLLSKAIREGLLKKLPRSIESVDVIFQENPNEKYFKLLGVDSYDSQENKGIYNLY